MMRLLSGSWRQGVKAMSRLCRDFPKKLPFGFGWLKHVETTEFEVLALWNWTLAMYDSTNIRFPVSLGFETQNPAAFRSVKLSK